MGKRIINLVVLSLLVCALVSFLLWSEKKKRPDLFNYNLLVLQSDHTAQTETYIKGLESGLKEQGIAVGKNLNIQIETLRHDNVKAVEQLRIREHFDLVLTIGSPAVEIFLSLRKKDIPFIFGLVCDLPASLSARIEGNRSDITGILSTSSLDAAIEQIRKANPNVKYIGVIAANRESPTAGKDLPEGIKICYSLVKDETDEIPAVQQMIKEKVEVIVALSGQGGFRNFERMVQDSTSAEIPIWGTTLKELEQGAVACLKTDYFLLGKLHGIITGDVLSGMDMKNIPVRDMLPQTLLLNTAAVKSFGRKWNFSRKQRKQAEFVIDSHGIHENTEMVHVLEKHFYSMLKPGENRKPNLIFVNYNDSPSTEENMNGFLAGMERSGYKLGVDYNLKMVNVNENLTEGASLFRGIDHMNVDIILVTTSPLLENCLKFVKDKPVIFSVVADPIAIKAGQSMSRHLPHVTGVSSMGDFNGMTSLIQECVPNATKVGTLYNPNEINSVIYRDLFAAALKICGMELVSVPNSSPNGVVNAAGKLAHSGIDVLCQISDNLHNRNFAGISNMAYLNRIPVFTFVKTNVLKNGATVALAYDYEAGGREQAALTVRVLKGESPETIPFVQSRKVFIVINMINARRCGLKIPQSVINNAEMIIE